MTINRSSLRHDRPIWIKLAIALLGAAAIVYLMSKLIGALVFSLVPGHEGSVNRVWTVSGIVILAAGQMLFQTFYQHTYQRAVIKLRSRR